MPTPSSSNATIGNCACCAPGSAVLVKAIEQVNQEFGVRSIFFVEDTSLRIESLSDQGDFPGLAVKERFSQITFNDLDRQLYDLGNDRRAKVCSDIALYVPTLQRPLFFTARHPVSSRENRPISSHRLRTPGSHRSLSTAGSFQMGPPVGLAKWSLRNQLHSTFAQNQ
jgi:hypothetical protein